MQFKVPQNIDKADQIVGPLTLVQFSYLAIGGALDILLNQTFTSALKFPFILMISVVALAFAFLKIQDRPLGFFITAGINYFRQPKTRIWHKVNDHPIFQLDKIAPPQANLDHLAKPLDQDKVKNLSAVLDAHGRSDGNADKPAPFDNIK